MCLCMQGGLAQYDFFFGGPVLPTDGDVFGEWRVEKYRVSPWVRNVR